MQARFILFLVPITLIFCHRQSSRQSTQQTFNRQSFKKGISNSSKVKKDSSIDSPQTSSENRWRVIEIDSILTKITKLKYNSIDTLKSGCMVDTGGFIKGSGLSIKGDCNEICETYLVEHKSGKRMLLPADFDSGLMGLKYRHYVLNS